MAYVSRIDPLPDQILPSAAFKLLNRPIKGFKLGEELTRAGVEKNGPRAHLVNVHLVDVTGSARGERG